MRLRLLFSILEQREKQWWAKYVEMIGRNLYTSYTWFSLYNAKQINNKMIIVLYDKQNINIIFFKRKHQKAQEGSRGRARQVDLQRTIGRPRRPRADCFYGVLFFNLFKKSSRSLFRYPTLGGLVRSRQILPRRYTLVHVSACRFPTYFAKIGPID